MKQQLVAALLALSLLASIGGSVPADKGGVPNANACHGQFVSSAASQGSTPGQIAQALRDLFGFDVNAGLLNQLAKGLCNGDHDD